RALQGNALGKVVPLRSVVRHDGPAKHQKASSQTHKHENSTFHLSPPRSGSRARSANSAFSDSDRRFPNRTLPVAATQRICHRDGLFLASSFAAGKYAGDRDQNYRTNRSCCKTVDESNPGNPEPRENPSAENRADESEKDVCNAAESAPARDFSRKPAGNEAD